MGLLDKIIPKSLKSKLSGANEQTIASGYRTITEFSPHFVTWDGAVYEQAQTRAIVECIATACSKARPEFVTPDGSNGSIPRIQRLFSTWPNDMMDWPKFIHRVITLMLVETTAFIVPGYDERDGSINSLWPLKPRYTEVVEYDNEPWYRFHLPTGDVQVFPFYDVAVLTRFQLDSDIFGGGNEPLTPTLRLMDAQRQAEEIALKTGADIRFIGKMTTNMHDDDMNRYRDRFAEKNFGPDNQSRLVLYDNRMDSLEQIDPQHFVIDTDEMERIDKTLFSYFTINQNILNGDFTEAQWAGFYELCIEPKLIALGSALTQVLLTRTQVRKGNYIMFSSGYLEYATPDTKVKVVGAMLERGVMNVNEARDVFQLPHLPGGTARMIRGEYYMIDDDNNIIAESGGRTDHDTTVLDEPDTFDDLDEPDDADDVDEVSRALSRQISRLIERRLSEISP